MTARHLVAWVAAACMGAVALIARQQQPSFRTTTDAVLIDVSVRDGRTLVPGLTAKDFALVDNGVPQHIDSVEATAVPIDLTLIVDVSGDQIGTVEDRGPTPDEYAKSVHADVAKVSALLRPDDRLQLLSIDTYGRQVLPLQPAASLGDLPPIDGGGMSSFYDALTSALVRRESPTRRHVVIALTKGRDTISVGNVNTIYAIAERSDAMLHLVWMESAFDQESDQADFQLANTGVYGGVRRFWHPFESTSFTRVLGTGHPLTETGAVLASAAELTGGGVHQAAGIAVPSMADALKQTLDDFRRSYVLRYTRQGPARTGWHEVTVTVPAHANYVARGRRGYAIDAGVDADAKPEAPDPHSVAGLGAAYDRGDHASVFREVLQDSDLLRDYRMGSGIWPDQPKRDAALALEIAAAGVFTRRDAVRDETKLLLVQFHHYIRDPLGDSDFERGWLTAELALAVGSVKPPFAQDLVTHAVNHYPGEPRILLAHAILLDQHWPAGLAGPSGGDLSVAPPAAKDVIALLAAYDRAANARETATEARLRQAWFLHRLGRDTEALARLDAIRAARPADTDLAYLLHLVRGRVLAAVGEGDPATTEFRAALTIVPGAQSAQVALMNGRLQAGDRAEAEALAEEIQRGGGATSDPWWLYTQGDLRIFDTLLAKVRELAK